MLVVTLVECFSTLFYRRWTELCGAPFWGASPLQPLPIPVEPVLEKLQQEAAGSGAAGGSERGAAARLVASTTGSSLGSGGGGGEAGANGLAGSTLQRSGASGGSGGSGGGSGDYLRGGTLFDGGPDHSPPQSGDRQQPAPGAGTPAAVLRTRAAIPSAAAAAAAADDPGATPAHPRAKSRTAGMAGAAAGRPMAQVIAAAAADGAAGVAPQFSAHMPPRPPSPSAQPAGSGSGGSAKAAALAAAGLDALVYHPSDSIMKPIVGNKRWVPTAASHGPLFVICLPGCQTCPLPRLLQDRAAAGEPVQPLPPALPAPGALPHASHHMCCSAKGRRWLEWLLLHEAC